MQSLLIHWYYHLSPGSQPWPLTGSLASILGFTSLFYQHSGQHGNPLEQKSDLVTLKLSSSSTLCSPHSSTQPWAVLQILQTHSCLCTFTHVGPSAQKAPFPGGHMTCFSTFFQDLLRGQLI